MKVRLALRGANKQGISSRQPLRVRIKPSVLARTEKKIAQKLEETVKQSGTTLTIKVKRPLEPEEARELGVNRSGTQIGLHNRANPPSSEHMRKVRAMRRFYGKQMPVPQCSTCAFSANCPQFKAGHECAFKPFLQSHSVDSLADLMFYMKELLGANMQRLHLATIFERLTGGTPSAELSESYAMLFQQLTQLHEMESSKGAEISVSTDDESIISKLFGGMGKLVRATEQQTRDIQGDLLDVPVEDGPQTSTRVDASHTVNGDLMAEFEHSQERADPEASKPKPKTKTLVENLLQVSTLRAT